MPSSPELTEAQLLHALRDCYDPRLRRNIVELGLVRSASLRADPDAPGAGIPGVPARFVVELVLAAPSGDEALNAQLSSQIRNRLAGMPAISRTELHLLPALFPILNGGHA